MKERKTLLLLFYVIFLSLMIGCARPPFVRAKIDYFRAERVDTIASYQEFIRKHHDSLFSSFAQKKMCKLVPPSATQYKRQLALLRSYKVGVTTTKQFKSDGWVFRTRSDEAFFEVARRGKGGLFSSILRDENAISLRLSCNLHVLGFEQYEQYKTEQHKAHVKVAFIIAGPGSKWREQVKYKGVQQIIKVYFENDILARIDWFGYPNHHVK